MSQSEQALAEQIWRSMVPKKLKTVTHYPHATMSSTAKSVGGDFLLTEDNWIVLGDVSGKGMPAALFTTMFMGALPLALQLPDPAKALEDALFDYLEQASMFSTLIAVHLASDGWISYVNLGNPPMMIRRVSTDVERLDSTSPPLGTFKLGDYKVRSAKLNANDMLCLLSDGITDAEKDGEIFGLSKLEDVLRQATTPQNFIQDLEAVLEDWERPDDLSLVCLQYKPQLDFYTELLERR